jgi:hypothetical protein
VTRPAPTGIAHSVLVRLKNAAQETGRPFAELLELYAVERLLHRLGRSRHRERFVLKGALLLRAWLGVDARPTRDVDLLGPVDLDAAALRDAIDAILRTDVENDGITFDHESIAVRPIRAGSAVLGLRAKFDAGLARVRLRYQVDVGLGDAVYPPEVEVVPGGLLGMPVASVRAYTPYTSVAEKLEAIVMLGDANSRTKDYYDHATASAIARLRRPPARRVDPPNLRTPRDRHSHRDGSRPDRWLCKGAPQRDALARFSGEGEPSGRGDRFLRCPCGHPALCRARSRSRPRRPALRTPLGARRAVAMTSYSGDSIGLRRFKPYPAYKDSGIEWQGKMPEHWKATSLKRWTTSIKDGTHGTFDRVPEGIPLLSAKNVGDDGQLQVSHAESLVSERDYEQINGVEEAHAPPQC